MNKKGNLVLRDVMFMLIILTGIIGFAALTVQDFSIGYHNQNMSNEFGNSSIRLVADNSFTSTKNNVSSMGGETQSGIGALVDGLLTTGGTIISTVFLAPVTFGNILTAIFTDLSIPYNVANLIGNFVSAIIYILIVFVILAAFLRGGKI